MPRDWNVRRRVAVVGALAVIGAAAAVLSVVGIQWWRPGDRGTDEVRLIGHDQATVLLSGPTAAGCVRDGIFSGGGRFRVPNMRLPSRSCPAELIAFSVDHGLQWMRWSPSATIGTTDRWTNGPDDVVRVSVDRDDLRMIDVAVWRVAGASDHEEPDPIEPPSVEDIVRQLGRADFLYNRMGCGVGVQLKGAPGSIEEPGSTEYENADACGKLEILSKLAWDPKALNLYAGAKLPHNGMACRNLPGAIALNSVDSLETTAHEIGHALALEHGDVRVSHNLMRSGAPGRNFLTLGQCFKANAHASSVLRRLLRVEFEQVTCTKGDCPDLLCTGCPRDATQLTDRTLTIDEALEVCLEGECTDEARRTIVASPANQGRAHEVAKSRLSGATPEEQSRMTQHVLGAFYELKAYAERAGKERWKTEASAESVARYYVQNLDAQFKVNAMAILVLLANRAALDTLELATQLRNDGRREVQQAYADSLAALRRVVGR